ncbi:toxin-antitoxin system HicB family antitoxin [Streptomyces sp. NPDC004838]
MTDANVRIPQEVHDRLAAVAAAEGLSLRAYLARLSQTLLTPAERAEKARTALKEWNGYAPTGAEEQDLDGELDRRLARVTAR